MFCYIIIVMILVVVLWAITAAEQTPITSEVFSDPICDRKGACFECSFAEVRQIGNCYSTGYVQAVFCTMTSSLNNTQEISYMSPCTPKHIRTISNFFIAWIVSIVATLLLFYNWRQLKLSKLQDYHGKKENIIKA